MTEKFTVDNLRIAYKVIDSIEENLDDSQCPLPFYTGAEKLEMIDDERSKDLYRRATGFVSECSAFAESNPSSALYRALFL